jgi:hypothetical protein
MARRFIGQEVPWDVQNRPATRYIFSLLSFLIASATGGCSDRGDLGRHSPSLVTKTYTGAFSKAREFLRVDDDYDLPLTAAEDALRSRAEDLQAISYAGVLAEIVRPPGSDGFSRVEAIVQDVRVDRKRFAGFVEAARQVMLIDDRRHTLLKGLDALTARRQYGIAVKRRGQNNQLIRDGVRTMRERSKNYAETLKYLPVEWPDVPLARLQDAYEDFHEDVVRFHAEIDQKAHMKLGKS